MLDQGASQLDVYRVVQPIVYGLLEGVNGSILAYGQTGSGKTHTLIGMQPLMPFCSRVVTLAGDLKCDNARGIAPRAAKELMTTVGGGINKRVVVEAAEIYCERVFDLLNPANADLQIKQSVENGVHIAGLVEIAVSDEAELNGVMQAAMENRTVGSTAMNAQSSRSHCIINIKLIQLNSGQKATRHNPA